MIIRLSKKLIVSTLLFAPMVLLAQSTKHIALDSKEVSKSTVEAIGKLQIAAKNASYYQMDVGSLLEQLDGIAYREFTGNGFTAVVDLPHPGGSMHTYSAKGNYTMHPDLASKYEQIRSFDATGENGAFVKWDVTQHGLHAMIMTPGQPTIFIDPAIQGNAAFYIVYFKSEFSTTKMKDCQFNSELEALKETQEPVSQAQTPYASCELRTYRLAVAATGEYTSFHGGSVADAQAAQVTTMNRVNGVYERDMAITMTIIGNNDQIIYTSAGADPYTNGNPGAMIGENQSNVNSVIGSSNYDIGHVFGTNSGGLAGLGVVCSNGKARGVTGSSAPIGDPFDIDYVAHEMGHQFGANHTFNNSCGGNRNNATAMEPGSGSTIMAYAGICSPNVQSNSDDHFHGISLEEIGIEISSGGHQCEQITSLANVAPIITSTNGNIAVPGGTPFALTAVVDDPDGDPITYNWEQMDNDISPQPPISSSNDGPNFRSWESNSDPTRYFPKLQFVANNGPFTWERLSDVSRTMNFRVSVRDNSPGPGSCSSYEDVSVSVDGNSGPFVVLYPSDLGIVWVGGSNKIITWDVANTDNAPVNCSTVDIFLSTDNGLSYTTTLATGVPNDGSELVVVPNVSEMACRVMVMSSNGTFFDVSDKRFEIQMSFAGIDEASINSSVSIYPNPVSKILNVAWDENIELIELTDSRGRLLKRFSVNELNELQINLANYSGGVYFVNLTSDQGKSVHSIIKE